MYANIFILALLEEENVPKQIKDIITSIFKFHDLCQLSSPLVQGRVESHNCGVLASPHKVLISWS